MTVKTIKIVVSSTYFCQVIVSQVLIEKCSTGFDVQPLPNDMWEITFKEEHLERVKTAVNNHLAAFPNESVSYEERTVEVK